MSAVPAEQPQGRVIRGMPEAEYHQRRLDLATASGLKQMLRSPAHFRHFVEEGSSDNPAFAFGRAFHCAVLEPDRFDLAYRVLPDHAPRRPTPQQLNAKQPSDDTKRAVAWWAQWNADGRATLSGEDYDRIRRMADSVRAHPVAAGLLVGGEREATFRWQDEGTGLDCQARADLYLAGEYLMDVKTCQDASKEGFAAAVARYRYSLQLAHYLSGIRACGDAIRWFVFLAVESHEPFVCQPHILGPRTEQLGFDLRERAITRQAECVKAGRWPGYSDELMEIEAPAWAHYEIGEGA